MRVTLVTETYFPQVNGVSRTLGELVKHLLERGDEVQLIRPNYGAEAERTADREGDGTDGLRVLRVKSIPMPFYMELFLPLPPFGPARRAIDEFRPDVVHIATEATLGLAALRHVRRRGLPVVSSFHTNFDQYSRHYRVGWSKGIVCRYLRWFHNRTRETYVPSPTTIGELTTMGFERLVLWPRGVDGTLFRPDRPGRAAVRDALGFAPDDTVISYVGRIAPEKNVGYLAEALAQVAARAPGVKVILVGDGPSRPELERRLGPIARFVGYRTGEDLADHYAAGDLFAFSSLTETFGNVVLEAMASGMPVVALRAGGVGDTVREGVNGLLVEAGDPPSRFAEALLSLVIDPGRRVAMAHAARAFALTQTWDAIMGGLRDRYEAAIRPEAGVVALAAGR
ncbi:GDP-mannose-dependent alpha-mannosyltransferase [Aquisphaera giovannonii]|uniref:GDP-mannose-dependent alpha-mannosyltransferase n=1 Tax=Aquisphaera giovannonii TaxID=406548 RepID=A0A5B9WBQ2_9BACT|nr:glycosyltransferase family 1 protein [Aquisphaera giovannonii]QEH38002.1 GDP-mannose-dependent alpha-mannosyltransferase [Aquisphaera giovannonii]